MALKYAGLNVELREVKLDDMPEEALRISSNATVPLLVLDDGSYMDESWDIVKWALEQSDPDHWFGKDKEHLLDAEILIETNDFSFKEDLDHYKYADRHPEHTEDYYRERCEEFIEELEDLLSENTFLLSDKLSLADIGVFPFVRQFSMVDEEWFAKAPYPKVRHWLQALIDSALFQQVFKKHELWQQGDDPIYL
jgi:glutathione S-transferase